MRLFGWVTVGTIAAFSSTAQGQEFVFKSKPPDDDYGYLVVGRMWNFSPNEKPTIFVCWENPTSDNQEAREWVKDQISRTWQLHTRLEFVGWQRCATSNRGIRISVADEGPHVKRIGRNIDGIHNGMVLNATFKNWGPECQKKREACIRSIAVHEFGHAIGFEHEQNRPDTPGECFRLHGQEVTKAQLFTPYDPGSVMNYCNPKYINNGELSPLDIRGAQKGYGKRT